MERESQAHRQCSETFYWVNINHLSHLVEEDAFRQLLCRHRRHPPPFVLRLHRDCDLEAALLFPVLTLDLDQVRH